MLYLVKLQAYGRESVIKHYDAKPAARGFALRAKKLLETENIVIEEVDEMERCARCGRFITNIYREQSAHDCM